MSDQRVTGFTMAGGSIGPFPPVFVGVRICADCRKSHAFDVCPLCGSWIDFGYGLAYGGFGSYAYCTRDGCEWFYKEHDSER